MKYFIGFTIALASMSCQHAQKKEFFVQSSSKLGKVVVEECSTVYFKNLDGGKDANRKFCKKIELTGKSKVDWERIRPKGEEIEEPKNKKGEENEDPTPEE